MFLTLHCERFLSLTMFLTLHCERFLSRNDVCYPTPRKVFASIQKLILIFQYSYSKHIKISMPRVLRYKPMAYYTPLSSPQFLAFLTTCCYCVVEYFTDETFTSSNLLYSVVKKLFSFIRCLVRRFVRLMNYVNHRIFYYNIIYLRIKQR